MLIESYIDCGGAPVLGQHVDRTLLEDWTDRPIVTAWRRLGSGPHAPRTRSLMQPKQNTACQVRPGLSVALCAAECPNMCSRYSGHYSLQALRCASGMPEVKYGMGQHSTTQT